MKDDEELTYLPVAGLSIKEALARAILLSKKNNKSVKALINDIEINVTEKTNLKFAYDEYQIKLVYKYEKSKSR